MIKVFTDNSNTPIDKPYEEKKKAALLMKDYLDNIKLIIYISKTV